MATERLDRREFHRWLASQPPYELVGYALDGNWCPNRVVPDKEEGLG